MAYLNQLICSFMQNDNELRDNGSLWSTFSKDEARSFLQGESLGVNHPARIFARDLVAKMGKPTLLDVPCGSGTDAEVLKDVCTYSGMDKTALLAETVAERYGVETIVGDIRKNDVKDGAYDVVLARAIFEHLPDLEDMEMAMKECVRIAKNDVIFAFYLPLVDKTTVSWNGAFFENRYGKDDVMAIFNRIGLPFDCHHVSVEGTEYTDSYDIFHLKKTSKKEVSSKAEAKAESPTEPPKKRGRPKKV